MGCSSSKAPAVKSDSSMYEMPTPSKDESLPWPDEEVPHRTEVVMSECGLGQMKKILIVLRW